MLTPEACSGVASCFPEHRKPHFSYLSYFQAPPRVCSFVLVPIGLGVILCIINSDVSYQGCSLVACSHRWHTEKSQSQPATLLCTRGLQEPTQFFPFTLWVRYEEVVQNRSWCSSPLHPQEVSKQEKVTHSGCRQTSLQLILLQALRGVLCCLIGSA